MKGKITKILFMTIVAGLLTCSFYLNKPKDQKVVSQNTHITYSQLLNYVNQFECGDIINLEHTHYLSSFAIPGKWKHSLIYIGTKQQFTSVYNSNQKYYQEILKYYKLGNEILIVDANSTGVKIRELKQMANLENDSFLKSFIVYRFIIDANLKCQYINGAMDYLGTPYDYAMKTFDDQALYCSELIYYALLKINLKIDQVSTVFNQKMITPSDLGHFLEKQNNVKIVMEIDS